MPLYNPTHAPSWVTLPIASLPPSLQVHVWDVSSSQELQVLPLLAPQEPALDMLPFGDIGPTEAGRHHLAILTQSKLHIYAWR